MVTEDVLRVPLPPGWEELQDSYYAAWDALCSEVYRELFKLYPDVPPECPWSTDDLGPELLTRQIVCYWGIDRIDPATQTTPLRRWVDEKVADPRLREALLWSEHPRAVEFILREYRPDGTALAQDTADGRLYTIRSSSEHQRRASPGSRVATHLQPWGAEWRFIGVSQIHLPPGIPVDPELRTEVDVDALLARFLAGAAQKIDDGLLRTGSPLPALLARYPSEWVDRIAVAVRAPPRAVKRDRIRSIASVLEGPGLDGVLDSLAPSGRELLRTVLAHGGMVPRNRSGPFAPPAGGEEFWASASPRSAAEILRVHGLLFYGRLALTNRRLRRMAMVPASLRGPSEARLAVERSSELGPRKG